MARGKKKESLTPEERLQAALVPESEQPYKVPENWCWCFLGNIAFIRRGASPRPIKTYVTEDEDGVNWIKIGDTSVGKYITHVNEKITEEGAKKSVFVEEGTLLLSNSMSFGHPYILKVKGCIHDGWLALTPSEVINKEYLYYALLTSEWYFEQVAVGTAVRNLNSGRVAETPTPLPPLSEQQRIVDRIESLFAKLDEARQKAQDALDSFETRKAAILHKAFTGELTAQWRKEHGVRMESWENVSVSEICRSLKYGTAKKSSSEGTVVVIRMGNLQDGEIMWDDLAYTNDEEDIEKYKLMPGDVLFNRTNSPALVGKTSIYRGEYPAIYAGYLIKLDYDRSRVIGDYLNYSLNTVSAKEYCNSVKTDGVNQSNINAKKIGAYRFDMPKINEQIEIVRILDDLLSKEQQARESAEGVLEQIDLIKKAILARAFRGELGTNDPTEENAVKLLCSWD